MADLDSLNIRVTASTNDATRSIDKLIDTLGKLNGAFNVNGLEGFVESLTNVSQTLNSLNEKPIKKIADAADKMSKISSNSFNGILEGLRSLQSIQLSDTLANINFIRDAIGKIGGKNGQAAGDALKGVASGLQAMDVAVPNISEELVQLAVGVRALGSGKIVNASTALVGVASGLRDLQNIGSIPQIEGLAELGKAIAVFGYKSTKEAVTVIPQLASAFRQLIDTLSTAPTINRNVIDLANAMANLLNSTRQMPPTVQRANRSLSTFVKHSNRAQKSAFSLASAIGKLYATYWAFIRVGRWLGGNLTLASDLTETQNVVDHVFGSMKDSMEDFAKTAVETVGMSELTAKQIGSRFQSMGMNMDIPDRMMKQTSEFVENVTNGYAKASDSMADMSINLTHLAGDMASFYNLPYEDVAEDLESIFTGTTKPMRKFGIDLTVANLKAWALANGLNADIKNMTLAEKALLRYQYVMAHTTAAQNDFIRTQGTWANQIKIAQENLKRLRVILGQIGVYTFKPLVKNFNAAMNDILHLAESTFNSLGKIFGWQIEITDVGILDDMADGLDDVADGYDDAGKEGKKFKNFLLGIDELNLLPDDKNKGDDSGAGDALGAMANGLEDSMVKMVPVEKGFESIYDTLFKLGKRINEVSLDFLKGIDWDDIYIKAEKVGEGLAEFLNGYFSDAELFYHKGRAIANGLNTVAHAIYGFFHEFDGYQLGKDLGFEINGFTRNLDWGIIKSAAYETAHDITEFVNGVIRNTNWKDVGRTIAEGINTAILFVSTFWNEIHWDQLGVAAGDLINSLFLNWDEEEAARMVKGKLQAVLDFANNLLSTTDFEMIGEKIGKFLSELNLAEYADDIAALIWNLIKAGFKLLPSMFEEAPIETALMLGIAGFKFNLFGAKFGNKMAMSVSSAFTPKMISFLTTDLSNLQFHSGILGAAEKIGTAVGTAFVAAAVAYIGYNFGLEIGKAMHPEDAMWYKQDAWLEALFNIGEWGNAAKEMTGGGSRSDFGHFDQEEIVSIYPYFNKLLGASDSDTWGDVLESLRKGTTYISESDFNKIKKFLEDSDISASQINEVMKHLQSARDEYVNGFKPWLQSHSGQYSLEEAYKVYQNTMKAEQSYAESLSGVMTNGARLEDIVKKTKSAFNGLGDAVANAGKKQQKSMSDAIDSQAEALGQLQEYQNFIDMIKVDNVFDFSNFGGGGKLENTVQQMALLHTNILNSKDGMEKLNAAFENAGKKDKSSDINDAYENAKSKMNDLGNMFSADKMDSMVSSIPKALKLAWSDALDIMKEMWSEMANWINENAKIEIPKVKMSDKEFGGQTMRIKVSKFDVGGSIPNNGSLFIANEKGPEVMANMGSSTGIMNTDQMEAAIANGMAKALAANGQNVTVVLQGDVSTLFTAMVKENNNAIMRVGSSPLRR